MKIRYFLKLELDLISVLVLKRFLRMLISLLVDNGEIGSFNILSNMVILKIVIVPSTLFSIMRQSTVPINSLPRSLRKLLNVVVQKSFNPTLPKSSKRNLVVLESH